MVEDFDSIFQGCPPTLAKVNFPTSHQARKLMELRQVESRTVHGSLLQCE